MENQLTTINNLPKTKEDIQLLADRVLTALDEGTVNPMDLLQAIKAVEKLHATVKPLLDKAVLAEVSKYPEKTVDFHGAKFTIKEVGTSYDYSACNDAEWNMLNILATDAKDKLKVREEFLKALKAPLEIFDQETGEIITLNPPVKKSTTSVSISFS
jgi:hypothetical protein